MAQFVNHLGGEPGLQVVAGHNVGQHRHRAGGGDFREGDDGQEQLHPLHPAGFDVAEHIAPQPGIERAVDPVVLFFLHGEVGAQHLAHRVFGYFIELIIGGVGNGLLDVGGHPA